MKHLLSFLAGIITGVLIAFAIPHFTKDDEPYKNSIILFKEIGDCVSTNNFKVLQVLNGGALALELIDTGIDKLDIPSGLVVFFKDEEGTSYYDGKVIKMSKGLCAKQIGIYRYLTEENTEKVVPIVQITKR